MSRPHVLKQEDSLLPFDFGHTTFDMGNYPNTIEAYFEQFGYLIQDIVKGDPLVPGPAAAKRGRFSVHVARPKG